MKSLKKIFFLYILLFSFSFGEHWVMTSFAQNSKIDSLIALIKKDKPDTNKVNHLNILGRMLMYQNPDTAILLSNMALDIITPISNPEFSQPNEIIEERGIRILRAKTYGNLGVFYTLKADYTKAREFFLEALKIDEELKNGFGISSRLTSLGNVSRQQGNYLKALEYYLKALKKAEEINHQILIAVNLGNIGNVYTNQEDFSKGLDYYLRALKMVEELGDKNGVAISLGNIGNIYYEQKNYTKALEYYFKSLKMSQDMSDEDGVSVYLGNIGAVYYEQKEYSQALIHYLKALKLATKLGNKNFEAQILGNIGQLYTKTGKFREAEQYLKRAIAIDEIVGSLDNLRTVEGSLSQLYDTTGRYKLALIHYKKSVALKDTLFSQESKKQLIRKELNYEFDKKESATKMEHDKQLAVAAAEKKKQQFILILVSCVLVLIFLFAGFVFRALRITRKQKNIIELQKNEVSQQKEIAEKQKGKILDSITYAQRIQKSILIEESDIQNYFSDSFIYYEPKDIVSGDFYWCSKKEDKIILAAIDCTGHGVPGAFMSMIGNTLLNQIVNEQHITVPSEILRLLNLGVYEALHQKKDDALAMDGMDLALCCIDYKNNTLQYAGARNPLYLLSDNLVEVIKADKFGIGGGGMITKIADPMMREYTNHTISIKKDLRIYLFSDGYPDQLGGSERKKFGQQQFKELLLKCQDMSMAKQKERLAIAHAEWKGSISQIDDMLVIGVKI